MDTVVFTAVSASAKYFSVGDKVTLLVGDEECETVVVTPEEMGVTELPPLETAYLRPLNPKPMSDGAYGIATITMDSRKDVLYVDESLVMNGGDRDYVYLLDENGLRITRDVQTGLEANGYVEIISGLTQEDKIVK